MLKVGVVDGMCMAFLLSLLRVREELVAAFCFSYVLVAILLPACPSLPTSSFLCIEAILLWTVALVVEHMK